MTRRTRTYSWDDPLDVLSRAAGMSGLEALQLIAAGELPPPPIAETLGFGPIEVEEGRATFTIEPAEFHYNPIGVVHGGLALALLDSAMGCAVHSTLPAGVAYTTLEVKANFVRPLTSSTGLDPLHRNGRSRRPDGRDGGGPHRRRRGEAVRARDEHAARHRPLSGRPRRPGRRPDSRRPSLPVDRVAPSDGVSRPDGIAVQARRGRVALAGDLGGRGPLRGRRRARRGTRATSSACRRRT